MTTFGQLAAGAEFHLEGGRITYRKCPRESIVQHDSTGRTTGTITRFGNEKPVIQGRPAAQDGTKSYSPFSDPPEYHESFI